MKKLFLLTIILISLVGIVFAEDILTCPRAEEILQKIEDTSNCNNNKFLELSAEDAFNIELDYFNNDIVEKIMLDNILNPNTLIQKGIRELRIHKLCLEISCDVMLNKCDTNKNFKENNTQSTWCEKTVENIFDIEKVKIETAVLENQRRKTRAAFREKFRAIEVRSNQYFIPNLISFTKEFKRFTEKVTAFILNPL